MKYLKIIFLILLSTVITNSQSLFKLNYNVSFPNSTMKQYVDQTSYAGVNFEYGQYISNGNYSVGVSFGWDLFSEKYYGVTDINLPTEYGNLNGAISGNQIKNINVFPMLVNGTYYFKPNEHTIVPFVSFGTGFYFINQRYQAGVFELENKKWHFGISTEAGLIYKIQDRFGLNTSAKLNYAFDSGESISGKDDNSFSFWTINFGITYLYGY